MHALLLERVRTRALRTECSNSYFSYTLRTECENIMFWRYFGLLKVSKIQKNFKFTVKLYLSSLVGKIRFHGPSSDRSAREPAKPVQVSLEYYKGMKVYGWVTNIIFSSTWGKIHFLTQRVQNTAFHACFPCAKH